MNEIINRGSIINLNRLEGIGSEQQGARPAIVLQNDVGNKYSSTTIVAPLTSRVKRKLPTHVFLKASDTQLVCDSIVLLEQIRVVDKSRLGSFISRVSDEIMQEINGAVLLSLGFAPLTA